MNSKWLNIILLLFIAGSVLTVSDNVFCQVLSGLRTKEITMQENCNQSKGFTELLYNNFKDTNDLEPATSSKGANPTKILTYSLAAFLYIFNPTFL